MLQRGRQARFGREPRAGRGIGVQLGAQDLQRDVFVGAKVGRLVDVAECAAADEFRDAVALADDGAYDRAKVATAIARPSELPWRRNPAPRTCHTTRRRSPPRAAATAT